MDHTDRIVLELRRGSAPISGTACPDAGTPQPFTGWTGLFALLQRMVPGAAAVPGAADGESTR